MAEPLPPTKGFVVSITKKGRHRKLHAVELCRLLPGIHYHQWKAHGDLLSPRGAQHLTQRAFCSHTGTMGRRPDTLNPYNSSARRRCGALAAGNLWLRTGKR